MRSDNVFISFIKKRRGLLLPAVLLLVGVIFLLLAGGKGGKTVTTDSALDVYRKELESEVSSLCSSVEGVGKCRVLITFSSGEETAYRGSSVISVSPPKVRAVTVVCRGGGDDRVRADLVAMLSATFDIGKNRVSVLKMT